MVFEVSAFSTFLITTSWLSLTRFQAYDTMTEALEADLRKILASQPVPIDVIDCQRNEEMSIIPVTKESICYIVAVILFNDAGQVLLVQEAKRQCYGMWYLPAGRLERNENFVDGAKREVKEEAGLECEVTSLISVLCIKATWMRFTFTGEITGGNLKTTAQADKESLQAQFYDLQDIYSRNVKLRATDIIPLLHQAEKYRGAASSVPLHPSLLPTIAPHSHVLQRPVIVAERAGDKRLYILASFTGAVHIPVIAVSLEEKDLSNTPSWTVCGLLSVEHCGIVDSKHDGLCLTSLISYSVPADTELPKNDFLCVASFRRLVTERFARTKGLQPGVCLLPVTQPDQLFVGAPGSQQLLGEITADGYENCIVQCCNNTEGLCNVVLYKVNIEEVQTTPNCRLYRCQPVAACSFYTFDGLEVFADVESAREGEVDGAKSTHAPAENTTSQGAHEVTEPEDREVYNTTVSPNAGAAKPGDNSTDTEGATTQNVTGTTVKSVSQTPSVANVTQPSDTFNKTEVSLVSEDPHWTDGGAISTSSTEERTGSTREQLTTTGPNPDVTTNQPQTAQTSPADDVAEGTNWQEVADQGTRFTSFSVLITSLVVGCLFFVAAIVLIVKRCHDGWKKRHYSRVEYLVEGMYEE
ncbi:hypothetical protein C0Q70_10936 [Pomacea canaliculata]|uniref:Nudix hydrolase domain-containing protein n=1 Tax=Pomacea canaliculata TaxID=400727 RepID=A0A2T7P4K8_POMCA|nr:hypothetical protein C0Q70_10936 [Pomacea canaliculata]